MRATSKTLNPFFWLLPVLLAWALLVGQPLSFKTASGQNSGLDTVSAGFTLWEAAPRLGFSGLAEKEAAVPLVEVMGGEALTSRAARREAMRDAGVPTSQQPMSQSRNASGREYSYDVPAAGGDTQRMSVQQQTMDRSHPGQAHWEAGRVKTDPRTGAVRENNYGRPALTNDKSKVDY